MISLIITTCDRPSLLKKAIESALDQKYVGEIIVIDDGHISSELTFDNVKVIKTRGYTGICSARNIGLDSASFPYIAYLDDDDLLYPDAYLSAINAFKIKAHNVIVLNVDTFKNGEKTSIRIPPSTEKGIVWGMNNDALIGGYSFLTKQSAVYKTEFLRLIGGWEEKLKSRSQSELFLRISQQSNIIGINYPCYCLNKNTSHTHLTDRIDLRFKSYLFLIIKYFNLWVFSTNGWRWFARQTINIITRIYHRYLS